MSISYLQKTVNYCREHGIKGAMVRTFHKLTFERFVKVPYKQWLEYHLPSEEELEKQRATSFAHAPLISIVVPVYRTPKRCLKELIHSIEKQTYTNWELCLSDGSGPDSPVAELLQHYEKKDSRIHVVRHDKPLRIAENTNAAIAMAKGEFIAFADHDDLLTPHALFACVKRINEKPGTEMLYSDEDKVAMNSRSWFEPQMKPDFNLDLLCTVNYICHLLVVRRSLLDKAGLLRAEYDGAQDYDFIFRCVEQTDRIEHIPQILYHWRSHRDSTSENPESKRYAFDAGRHAVEEHYKRAGIAASVSNGEFLGLYRTKYILQSQPLISILIPNKDHIEDLKNCMQAIEEKSTYRNFAFVIVENNSEEEATFAYYQELEKTRPNVQVVTYTGEFNYSKINNFGAKYAKGEYLLLLNNDTEIINADCLEELLGYCMRDDVGAVGARLYYEDGTIQHAGVIIGFGGIAGHAFVQHPHNATGYCHRIISAQDLSAVTAACMLVKRSVFDAVGGFTEELAVAFNDIDLCMKIRQLGKLIVYNPYAELYHYESKSRGLEDTPEKVARFNHEIDTFARRWPQILRDGDPYYNPNLTLETQDFALKKIPQFR